MPWLCQDGHLKTILEGISELASDKVIAEDELAGLQSILVKVLSHFKDLEDVFSLVGFWTDLMLDILQLWPVTLPLPVHQHAIPIFR